MMRVMMRVIRAVIKMAVRVMMRMAQEGTQNSLQEAIRRVTNLPPQPTLRSLLQRMAIQSKPVRLSLPPTLPRVQDREALTAPMT
jgi:hypothetical protein